MQRPVSHVTGDLGLANVTRALVAAGWACDRVISDYGEDLVVQTTLNGVVDTFRTLVQVKTSRSIHASKGVAVWRVTREHALRWVRNAEPVLLVLWDLEHSEGRYAIPGEQFVEYDLLTSTTSTVAIRLPVHASLSVEELARVAWSLRLMYFRTRILSAQQRDADHEMEHEQHLARVCKYKSAVGTVVFELLCTFGFVTRRGLSGAVRKRFHICKRNLTRDFYAQSLTSEDRVHLEREAVLLVVIAQIQEIAGVGVPTAVALEIAPRLLFLLKGGAKPAANSAVQPTPTAVRSA
jgi:hypothetical protein